LDKLLPDDATLVSKLDVEHTPTSSSSSNYLFRCYIIVSMTFIWTGYTIAVRFTRSTTPRSKLYSSTTVVLMSEIVKLLITLLFLFRMKNSKLSEFIKCISDDYIGKPLELIKMSVPSIMYAIQNNLDFIALSNLDAGTYQVTTQLKVVTTAIFMMLILGRKFSLRRWIAITLLFIGVAAVQVNVVQGQKEAKPSSDNYLFGLMAVLMTCVTAGFAGVYFEMMLKDGTSTPLWIRNLQMYSCGVVSASVACYLGEFDAIIRNGFFHGYSYKVVAIIAFLSVGGIYISLVMKYLDNLYKSFASAVSIILVVIISLFLFDNVHIGFYFVVGSFAVCCAILLYNSVDE
uniref:UDP-galactose translocator 1 (inferred by orthology to a C. elegans protein) n=1 Tax=Anisakis simplex TaxID=6269 RepID=A0A0M3K0Q6_ANISI